MLETCRARGWPTLREQAGLCRLCAAASRLHEFTGNHRLSVLERNAAAAALEGVLVLLQELVVKRARGGRSF